MRRSKKRKEYGDEGAGGWREDGEKVRRGGGGKERSGEDGEGRGRRRKVLEMFGNNGGVVERKMYKSGGDDRGREGEE